MFGSAGTGSIRRHLSPAAWLAGLLVTAFATGAAAQGQGPEVDWHWTTPQPGFQSMGALATGADGTLVAVGRDSGDRITGAIVGFTPTGEEFMNYLPAFDERRTATNDVAILTDGRIVMSMERFYPNEPTLLTVALYEADGSEGGRVDVGTLPPMSHYHTSLAALPDGGFALAKTFLPDDTLAADAFIARFTADGARLPDVVFDGPNDQGIGEILGLSDNGLLVVGWNGAEPQEHHWVARLDADGTILWEQTYDDAPGRLSAVAPLPDGGFLVGGFLPLPEYNTQGIARWLSADGEPGPYLTLDEPNTSSFRGVATMPDGGSVLVGSLRLGAAAEDIHRAFMMRLSADYQLLWRSLNNHPMETSYSDVVVLPNGAIAAAGHMRVDGQVEVTLEPGIAAVTETEPEVNGVDAMIVLLEPEE